MATEFVRVKDPGTNHEVTVPASFAKAYKLDVLDKPATNDDGKPLVGKPHVELAKADNSTGAGTGNPETVSAPATTEPSSAEADTSAKTGQQAGKAGAR